MCKQLIKFVFGISGILIFNFSCKVPKENINAEVIQLPSKYNFNFNDSLNSGQLNWKEFVQDDNLKQIIDSLLNSNFDLEIANQQVFISQANTTAAKGKLLPTAGLNVAGSMRRFGLYTMDGAGNATTDITPGNIVPVNLPDIVVGFQAAWEVDVFGKNRNLRRSAQAKLLQQIYEQKRLQTSIISQFCTLYFELVALKQSQRIIGENIQKQAQMLEITEQLKQAGRTTELAVQQFKISLSEFKALQIELSQEVVEKENEIQLLLGKLNFKFLENQFSTKFQLPKIYSGIPSQLLQNRPDVLAAQFALQASGFDLRSAKAAFYPNLNITGSFGYQAFNSRYLFVSPASLAYQAIGSILQPLVNRSAIKSEFKSAKARQIEALAIYHQTILQAFFEVQNQLSLLDKLNELQNLAKERMKIVESSGEIYTELYMAAKANYIEVLAAQQNALEAQFQLVELEKRKNITLINTYRALGGGWK
jgi:NodT family efflux transporter outer membrane factor (OMF) lipoprotein